MPFPLGHTAIGLATHEVTDNGLPESRPWSVFAAIVFLANLPDLDMVAGLLLTGDGGAFHRGPTHSLLFALAAGFLASRAHRVWGRLPRLSFLTAFALVLSHVVADMLLTSAPVSLLWPLQVHFGVGAGNWGDVFHAALYGSLADVGILAAALLFIAVRRAGKRLRPALFNPLAAMARKRP